MSVFAPTKLPFARADRLVIVEPCGQSWSGNSSVADQVGTDELILEIFQEKPEGSDLLDSIVLSVVLLRSGYSFGDYEDLPQHDPSHSLFSVTGLARRGR